MTRAFRILETFVTLILCLITFGLLGMDRLKRMGH